MANRLRHVEPDAPLSSCASHADGFLTVFKLSAQDTDISLDIKQPRKAIKLYQGKQRTTTTGTVRTGWRTGQAALQALVVRPQ